MEKRRVETVIISDVHLGTYGCRAKELLKYLRSIETQHLILNGDIVDMWQFRKRYWPNSHMQVIKHIVDLINAGTRVDYITGNHDEMLRKFTGFKMGSFQITNKLLLNLNGKKTWIFHGDVFDVTMKHSKWLCKLGAIGYDTLILINGMINRLLELFGRERISLSKKVKNSIKSAVKFIDDFENTAAEIGVANNYHNVVCGHIHQPQDVIKHTKKGSIRYLNSGDWIENLTALEYNNSTWSLYKFDEDEALKNAEPELENETELNTNFLFEKLLAEMSIAQPIHVPDLYPVASAE